MMNQQPQPQPQVQPNLGPVPSMAKAMKEGSEVQFHMKKPTWFVFMISSFFDVMAFGLCLGAQSKRNKVEWEYDEIGNFWYCKYNVDSASGMAGAAFCLLLIGTLVVMGASKCFCCGWSAPHMPGASRLCAMFSLILCWLFFGIAEILLLAGANKNSLRTRSQVFAGTTIPSCELIRSSVFAAAAAFTFLAWILSQVFYVFEVRCRLEPPTTPQCSMYTVQTPSTTPTPSYLQPSPTQVSYNMPTITAPTPSNLASLNSFRPYTPGSIAPGSVAPGSVAGSVYNF